MWIVSSTVGLQLYQVLQTTLLPVVCTRTVCPSAWSFPSVQTESLSRHSRVRGSALV